MLDIKKENIKMKVNEEQSKKVQEICFELGITWQGWGNPIELKTSKDVKNLYITGGRLSWGEYTKWFREHQNKEVSAEEFIKTKGFTISEEQEELLRLKVLLTKNAQEISDGVLFLEIMKKVDNLETLLSVAKDKARKTESKLNKIKELLS